MAVVGVDACRRGWVAVALDEVGRAQGRLLPRLDRLTEQFPGVTAVGIDIPMGLPAAGRRLADLEARALVGPRRSSVFFTPVREALVAPTHAEASARSRRLTGHGISQQAYALGAKILEAERWSADRPFPVWEVHPEVSFTLLSGHPARAPKSTWTGVLERQRALAGAGIDLDDVGDVGALAGPDDVLDATVVAWSTARLARGEGRCLPDPPEHGPDGPMAIRG